MTNQHTTMKEHFRTTLTSVAILAAGLLTSTPGRGADSPGATLIPYPGALQEAGVEVSLMGGCPLIAGWQAGPSSVETKETVEAKVVEPTTYPICIWKDGVPTASATAFATA